MFITHQINLSFSTVVHIFKCYLVRFSLDGDDAYITLGVVRVHVSCWLQEKD